jgi:hypothetical protein
MNEEISQAKSGKAGRRAAVERPGKPASRHTGFQACMWGFGERGVRARGVADPRSGAAGCRGGKPLLNTFAGGR